MEVWLNDVQNEMIKCLTDIMIKAHHSYIKTERHKWILDWPGQAVLTVSQIYWTMQVEMAIKTKGNRGLKEYVKVITKKIYLQKY